MRIVHVTPFYPPSIGGVEAIVKSTVEELARRGYKVFVITTNLNNKLHEIAKNGVYREDAVVVFRLKTFRIRIGYASFMNGLKNVLREINPDIVHCHNLHPHLFQTISWKSRMGYRIVAQLHNPVAAGIDHFLARSLLKPSLYYFKCKARHVDAVIAHTNLELNWLKEIGIDERKIFKIRFPGVPLKLIERYPRKETKNIVLYIGRICERKGLHILLKAASLVKSSDLKFVIAGPKDEQYFKLLKILRDKLHLENRVLFLDPLSEEEKYALMSSSYLFVHPAIKDYTPVTLIEAQALGTPVIASNIGGIPELVRNGITGLLVEPGNAIKLAEAIETIAEDRGLWTKMSFEARKWIIDNFLLEKLIDELEVVYHKIGLNRFT